MHRHDRLLPLLLTLDFFFAPISNSRAFSFRIHILSSFFLSHPLTFSLFSFSLHFLSYPSFTQPTASYKVSFRSSLPAPNSLPLTLARPRSRVVCRPARQAASDSGKDLSASLISPPPRPLLPRARRRRRWRRRRLGRAGAPEVPEPCSAERGCSCAAHGFRAALAVLEEKWAELVERWWVGLE